MGNRFAVLVSSSLFLLGCNQTLTLAPISSAGSTTSLATTAGATVAGTSTASGGATSASGSGGNGTGGPTSGGSAGSSTGGSATGGAALVDGGYVFCSMSPTADGGSAYWMCQPGTYFCDSTSPGNCWQCRQDEDCTNPVSPTYDVKRPHCDLSSGVPGYQNFCQQCTHTADCSGNPAGDLCDLSPFYPPAASPSFPTSLEPSIVALGFETCGDLQTDCRLDGGPACVATNQYCDSTTGVCLTRSFSCKSDQDCVGVLSTQDPYVLTPFCAAGTCQMCDGGICPSQELCSNDAQCGNPDSSGTGLTCDLSLERCVCTDSSQCGAPWPICVIQPGAPTNKQGQFLGTCGCQTNADCGNPELICMDGNATIGFASIICGLPCTSPNFPACQAATGYPICNAASGSCESCTSDEQCKTGFETGGFRCDLDGGSYLKTTCGCFSDDDCPTGESCNLDDAVTIGVCSAKQARCTPLSCGGFFCDWFTGLCLSNFSPSSAPTCYDDFDCISRLGPYAPFCQTGSCVQCRENSDCIAEGRAALGEPICCGPNLEGCNPAFDQPNTCAFGCGTDQDCAEDLANPHCAIGDAGQGPHCGCASDADCASHSEGLTCDLSAGDPEFGYCICTSASSCPGGKICELYGTESVGTCFIGCQVDADCEPGAFCDPAQTCRPRCDNGNSCQGQDQICDTLNRAGQNGQAYAGKSAGVVWCYSCLGAGDCDGGSGCSPLLGCGTCTQNSDCPSDTVCIDGGVCQPACDQTACPAGEVCDVHGLAGYGPNVCYQCATPADCPDGEGCNSWTHTCGTCNGPNARFGGPFDCPPGSICSNYWSGLYLDLGPGVCLANCDDRSCPASQPFCDSLPGLTLDHKYCFGCLRDYDCADAGSGAWCELAPDPTFTCQPGPEL